MEDIQQKVTNLAGDVGSDVDNITSAFSGVANEETRQGALSEIWSSLQSIWNKIGEAGIITTIIDAIKGFFASITGSGGAEGTPLLGGEDNSGILGKVAGLVPEGVRGQISGILGGSSSETAPTVEAPTTDAPATQAV